MAAVAQRSSRFLLALAALFATQAAAVASDGAPQSSGEISAMIKAGLPVFESKPEDLKVDKSALAEKPKALAEFAPPSGVVRMSPYVMREKKPLTDDVILNSKGVTFEAMDKYLGSTDGWDRGFLNAYTLPELWSKVPLLGMIPFAGPPGTVTNEERALRLYRADRRAELLKEQADFVAFGKTEAVSAGK